MPELHNEQKHDRRQVIVFDTDCVFCSGAAHFIIRHERDRNARFVSAWSPEGAELAKTHGLTVDDLDQTFLVVEDGKAFLRSDAALAIAGRLRMPWRAARLLRFLPVGLRDAMYGLVARNRYRWFGRRDACFIPTERDRGRFVAGTRAADRSLEGS